jgi:ABC-type transporter Mla subunit MlaD
MKSTNRFTRSLRGAATALFVIGLAVWALSGARLGWTQTSVVHTQRDEITGIDYPVRKPGFVAGVDVPLLATITAAALLGASFLPRRAANRAG